MIHSNWGDWFIESVEAVTPDGLMTWYLGCNGFIVRSPETTIYIDPFFGDGLRPPTGILRMLPVPMAPSDATACSAVLATHEHLDHFHPPSFDPLVEDLGAMLYAPSACYEQEDSLFEGEFNAPDDGTEVVEPGGTFEINDVQIHVRGSNDPDAKEAVSYVIQYRDQVLFHGGDTKPAPEFEAVGSKFDIDLGILAIGSAGRRTVDGEYKSTTMYMDENQIIEAAHDLRVNRLLPSHFDIWKGFEADPKALQEHAKTYPYPRVVEHATIGDCLKVDEPGVVPVETLQTGDP